jgi:serine/threonine protein phosphatase 1
MGWLRNPFSAQKTQRPAPSTDGRLVYAVGDVHGCLGLLRRLMLKILEDIAATGPSEPASLVFLGDYVDRGSQSRGVIDYIDALSQGGLDVHRLKGNHEEAMLRFLDKASAGPAWTLHGGGNTLLSYGVAPPMMGAPEEEWEEVRLAFAQRLPPSHRAFLDGLELSLTIGDYVFVHAGLRPGVSLDEQTEHDMLWIREPFLSRADFQPVIVHGHTPARDAYLGPNRIGVDTGAYASGVLTAVRLYGREQSVLQADTENDN